MEANIFKYIEIQCFPVKKIPGDVFSVFNLMPTGACQSCGCIVLDSLQPSCLRSNGNLCKRMLQYSTQEVTIALTALLAVWAPY